ncbi:MAG: hypothetical protein EHM31_13890, partial [Candidatus Aminicenantes bacterium]
MKRKEFLKMTAGLAGGMGVAGLPLMQRLVAAGSAPVDPPLPLASAGAPAGSIRRSGFASQSAAIAAEGGDEAFRAYIRGQFILDPGWTFLNFGGLGSCPLPVINAITEYTRAEERAPSAGHDEKPWLEVKTKLARALGKTCRKEDLGLIGGAT